MKAEILRLILYLLAVASIGVVIVRDLGMVCSKSTLFVIMFWKTLGDIAGLIYIIESIKEKYEDNTRH